MTQIGYPSNNRDDHVDNTNDTTPFLVKPAQDVWGIRANISLFLLGWTSRFPLTATGRSYVNEISHNLLNKLFPVIALLLVCGAWEFL